MIIDNQGIPYNAPLTDEQKKQFPSGILPSGEANYYDFTQSSKPLNETYPSPTGTAISGIVPALSGFFPTYPKNANPIEKSGIFNYENLVSRFSNVNQVSGLKIESFELFNPVILHYQLNDKVIKIPYISTYKVSISYDPYLR
jgi:hypothetical protein